MVAKQQKSANDAQAPPGTPEQARPARLLSGLNFQIHNSRDYLVTILEALLLTIGLAWQKSVSASLPSVGMLTKQIKTFKAEALNN